MSAPRLLHCACKCGCRGPLTHYDATHARTRCTVCRKTPGARCRRVMRRSALRVGTAYRKQYATASMAQSQRPVQGDLSPGQLEALFRRLKAQRRRARCA